MTAIPTAVRVAPPAGMAAVIEVRDVDKTFGPVKAVDGLSFEGGRGEIFGLVVSARFFRGQ